MKNMIKAALVAFGALGALSATGANAQPYGYGARRLWRAGLRQPL